MTDELTTDRRERVARARDRLIEAASWGESMATGRIGYLAAEGLVDEYTAAIAAYESTLQAERDALAAALAKAREQVVWLVEHVAEDWAPEAEEAVRADLAAIDAALALLPSPASQEAVSDG